MTLAEREDVTTQQKEQKQIFGRVIEQWFNQGDLAVVEELFSPGFVEHQALGANAPRGREAPSAIIQNLRRSFSDFSLAIVEHWGVPDRLAILHQLGHVAKAAFSAWNRSAKRPIARLRVLPGMPPFSGASPMCGAVDAASIAFVPASTIEEER
jgi:SnoaL-like protein